MDIRHALETVAIAEAVAAREDVGDDDPQPLLETRASELDETVTVLLEAGQPTAALRLVGALSRFCQERGLVDLGRELTERVLRAAGGQGTDRQRAAAWLTAGELAFRQGDQSAASTATESALRAALRANETSLQFRARWNLARIAFRDGDSGEIRRHAQQMLEAAGDDPRRRYGAIHMLAWAEHTAGHVERAVELFEQNVEIAREASHPLGMASELINLGAITIELGELDKAAGYLTRGLELAVELDSGYLLPGALAEVGRLAVLEGHTEPGLRLIAAAEHHYEMAGLAPDPGDDAFVAQRDAAVRSLGADRAEAVLVSGREMPTKHAIALAREELGGS